MFRKTRRREWRSRLARLDTLRPRGVAWLANLWRRTTGRLRRQVIIARMLPADIVLASPRTSRLSLIALLYRLFLRSHYVHAMLYLGEGRVIHSTTRRGVTIDPLPQKLFDRERYSIRRVPSLTETERQQVILEACSLLDHGLDHAGLVTNIPARWFGLQHPLLSQEKNRLWCSKLIHLAYTRAGTELLPDRPAGTVTSEDLGRSPLLQEV